MRNKITLFVIVLFFATSCSNRAEEINATADAFLKAYFNNNFDEAANLCTDKLKGLVLEVSADFEKLEPSVKDAVMAKTVLITTEIVSINEGESKDTISLNYKIIFPDSTTAINSSLQLIRAEESWKINALNL